MILGSFLRAYHKHVGQSKYIEDLHYSFFEYAGSNIRHYSFSKGSLPEAEGRIKSYLLSNKIWMLADQDSSAEKRSFHRGLKRLSNRSFVYQTTVCREIENALPNELLQAFVESLLKKKVDLSEFNRYDYVARKKTKIGSLLQKVVSAHSSKAVSLLDVHGNLKTYYKTRLAEIATSSVNDGSLGWREIAQNPYAKRVVQSLSKFLDAHISVS